MATEILLFLGLVAVVAVVGVVIGMLVARPLDRADANAGADEALAQTEEPRGDDRTDD